VHLPSVDRHDDPSTPEAASSMPVKPLSWVRKKCQKLVDQKRDILVNPHNGF
jgi:hypothetical protein